MNSLQSRSRGRQSILINQKNELNLVDMLFVKSPGKKKAKIINQLNAKDELFSITRLSILSSSGFPKCKSFRIQNSKSKFIRVNESPPPRAMKEVICSQRARRRSFDILKTKPKERLKAVLPFYGDRTVSDDIDYLKSEIIDSLVGISLPN
jgi:hypothetical protein